MSLAVALGDNCGPLKKVPAERSTLQPTSSPLDCNGASKNLVATLTA